MNSKSFGHARARSCTHTHTIVILRGWGCGSYDGRIIYVYKMVVAVVYIKINVMITTGILDVSTLPPSTGPIAGADNMEISFPLRLPPTSGRSVKSAGGNFGANDNRPADSGATSKPLVQHRSILHGYYRTYPSYSIVGIFLYSFEKNERTSHRLPVFSVLRTDNCRFFFFRVRYFFHSKRYIASTHGIY